MLNGLPRNWLGEPGIQASAKCRPYSILFRPFVLRTARSFSRCATDRSFVASRTSGRDPPPTHLADVLDGFFGHSCEQSGLKQLKRSTKKLVLSKTKLDEDIPGGSTAESVPPSDELEHVALIGRPDRPLWSRRGQRHPADAGCNCVAAPCHLQFLKGKLGTRLVDVPRANGCAAPAG